MEMFLRPVPTHNLSPRTVLTVAVDSFNGSERVFERQQ
jgi:hypothetical protein